MGLWHPLTWQKQAIRNGFLHGNHIFHQFVRVSPSKVSCYSFDYMMYILYSLYNHMHVCALIGPSDPEQPTSLSTTGTSFNGTTINWTIPRIAYTPETYTVHFGTSAGSLTPFNQQLQSGDNFTATNLQFSVQLTGLTPATDYSYRVVATNTIGRTAMSVIGMFRTLDVRKCDVSISRHTNFPLMHCSIALCNYLHSCHWSSSELYGCHSGWSADSADILMGPTTAS